MNLNYTQRTRFLGLLAAGGAVLFLVRLFSVQVVEHERWTAQAESQLSSWRATHPSRGRILDAKGRVLATDESGFDLVVRAAAVEGRRYVCKHCGFDRYHRSPKALGPCPRCRQPKTVFEPADRRDMTELARLLEIPVVELQKRVGNRVKEARAAVERVLKKLPKSREKQSRRSLWADHGWRERRVASDVSYDVAREIELHRARNPEFKIRTVHTRRMRSGSEFVHVVGSVAEAHEKMTAPDGTISYVESARGTGGLEKRFEPELSGVTGWMRLHYDRITRKRTMIDNQPPVHGFDLQLTIDTDDQVRAAAALSGVDGAFVVVNADTGAVIAMVSAPTYEPGDYAKELAVLQEGYEETRRWPRIHPLLEAASGGWFEPGSVLKPITALSALTSRLSTPATVVRCEHLFRNRRGDVIRGSFRCNGTHGEFALREALVSSCNIYFQTLMAQMYERNLLEHHEKICHRFGFGRPTGIEVEPGKYPDTFAFLDEKAKWGSIILSSIGQARVRLSPAQVARAYAGIATGRLPRLHLVARCGDRRTEIERTPLGIPASMLEPVREALREVPRSGTAQGHGLDRYGVACKTGTAERRSGREIHHNAWLAGFVPARAGKPPLAFAMVILETLDHGAHACAGRVVDFLAGYYGDAAE